MFVFNKYASDNVQPGQRIRMDVQEFGELIQDSGMMNEELNELSTPLLFSQALRLRVNELDSDKHL